MLQFIYIFYMALTLSLWGQGESTSCPVSPVTTGETNVAQHATRATCRDTHASQIEKLPSPVAVLSNPQQNYRFSSSRPQRILPVQASKQKRLSGRQPVTYKYRQPFIRHYGGRNALLSAPFQAAVSRDYFIIALRRIIR